MDIERVQPPQGLRVERSGSEQQRRRKQELQEAFDELLESTLTEDETEDQAGPGEGEQQQGADTVSITNGLPTPTLVNDYVSISGMSGAGKEADAPRRDTGGQAGKPADPDPDDSSPTGSRAKEKDQPTSHERAADEGPPQPAGIDTLA
jgi:hypothetical protein